MLTRRNFAVPRWDCVHFTGRPDRLQAALSNLTEDGFFISEVDLGSVGDKSDFFRRIAAALQFPEYFGFNWDAFDECLRDMSWLPAKGYVLIVRQATQFWHTNLGLSGSLVKSWLFCAEEWAKEDVPLHLVFMLSDEDDRAVNLTS